MREPSNIELFLRIEEDTYVEFESNDGTQILHESDYAPDDWGHSCEGTYHYFGSGGVQAEGRITKTEGWTWLYRDMADPDEIILSCVFPTKQEAFEDAMNTLYFPWDKEDRLDTLSDWCDFAHNHGLDDTFIDSTLVVDNVHLS